MPNRQWSVLSVYAPPEIVRRVAALASRNGLSVSAQLRELLARALDQEPPQQEVRVR